MLQHLALRVHGLTGPSGPQVSGEASACCAAVEFLQSLLGTVSSQTVTLRYPGVARFLLDEPGQSLLQELESCFQCVFGLEHVRWSPPNSSVWTREAGGPGCKPR